MYLLINVYVVYKCVFDKHCNDAFIAWCLNPFPIQTNKKNYVHKDNAHATSSATNE